MMARLQLKISEKANKLVIETVKWNLRNCLTLIESEEQRMQQETLLKDLTFPTLVTNLELELFQKEDRERYVEGLPHLKLQNRAEVIR